ncbi:biotin transporter BioY, partial [bacterium]
MVQPIKLVASANGFLLSAVLVVGMACLTAAGAQLEIPWQPVPFTLQTAPVLLSGLLL